MIPADSLDIEDLILRMADSLMIKNIVLILVGCSEFGDERDIAIVVRVRLLRLVSLLLLVDVTFVYRFASLRCHVLHTLHLDATCQWFVMHTRDHPAHQVRHPPNLATHFRTWQQPQVSHIACQEAFV